jgi:hypothetical protein
MKLFVDDIRNPEDIYPGETDWHLARTITEAIRILATQEVSHVSLDHDIQCNSVLSENGLWAGGHVSPETYEPIAWYLGTLLVSQEENPYGPPSIKRITLHSANPAGRKKMSSILVEVCTRLDIALNELPGCPAYIPDV